MEKSELYSLLAIRHSPAGVSLRSAGRLELLDRLRQELVHVAVDLVVRLGHALGVEILAQLREHAGTLDRGEHHLAGVGIGVRAGKPELFRRPLTQHAVAPGGRLELELLVVREPLLEAFLALVEGGHGRTSWCGRWTCISAENGQINASVPIPRFAPSGGTSIRTSESGTLSNL